ncbi:hypothetical protein G6F58_011731 [Rhizopus delemar]|nr:hypothetical protein G6F58_011731 [Rhizopus delemar]
MDRNVTDHKIDTIIDSFELYVENNSDDDFQSVVTARKRKSRENTPQVGLQKRLKGKGKVTDSEITIANSTSISTTDETIMFNKITLYDYDLEYSTDDFDAPVVKRPFLGESTKSAFRITKSTSAAVESSTTASKISLTSPKPSKPVTKDFFVEVFLSLVLSKGGNSTRLKDTTKNYRRLLSKYKEAYFEDAGYTPQSLP